MRSGLRAQHRARNESQRHHQQLLRLRRPQREHRGEKVFRLKINPTLSKKSFFQFLTLHYLSKDKDGKLEHAENYKRLRPILNDILILHDTVSAQGRDLYNEGGGKKGGKLKFMEGVKSKKIFQFPFIGEEREYRLSGGALIPMIGAFRAAVEIDSGSGNIVWRRGFAEILKLWQQTAKDLMEATQETSEELGRNPNAIGKSKKHWAFLHNLVFRRVN
jgi:hypothetical protein